MLRELKTLLAVVKTGSFAAAGARIGLTQSAVSAQIQRLEEALDASLFDRTGRSATLNAAGMEAARLAEQILHLFDDMRMRVAQPQLRGLLRIGAIQTCQAGLLPDALALLQAEHPEVSARIYPGSSLYLLSQVDSGDMDAALMVRPAFDLPRELSWTPLLREPFMLATPSDADGDDWRTLLTGRPFIRYDSSSFGGRVVERFLKRHGLEPRNSIEAQDVDAITQMVARGLGVALLPMTGAHALPQALRLLPLGADTFYREVGLVGRTESDRKGLIQVLTHSVARTARAMAHPHPDLPPPDTTTALP